MSSNYWHSDWLERLARRRFDGSVAGSMAGDGSARDAARLPGLARRAAEPTTVTPSELTGEEAAERGSTAEDAAVEDTTADEAAGENASNGDATNENATDGDATNEDPTNGDATDGDASNEDATDDDLPSGDESVPDDRAAEAADARPTALPASELPRRDVAIDLPDAERIDRPVRPRITGLPPAATVRLSYRTTDPDGDVWSGSATFAADSAGVVDLGETAPLAGSYEAADPMGPFWSMTPEQPRVRARFPFATHDVEFAVEVIDLPDAGAPTDGSSAADSETVLASATTTRRLPSVETEPAGDDLVGTIHLPPSVTHAPAVLVLHGSDGAEPRHVARLFADSGFVALSLQYFGEPGPVPDDLAAVPLSYVRRAIDRLRAHERTDGGDVGLYGASKGGELALLAGVHAEHVGAVASVAGSAYVWEGLTANWRPAGTSSWSLDGEPLDYLSLPRDPPSSVEGVGDTYEYALEQADESTLAAARIPVEAVDAPTVLVSGGDDGMWPSESFARTVVDRCDRPDVEHVHVPEAGHAIEPPYVPTWGRSEWPGLSLGGTPAADASAAARHWPAVLDCFERALDTA